MYTRCPRCRSLFRVYAEQLKMAQGYVRCGRCEEVFNALARLSEDLATAARERDATTAAEHAATPSPAAPVPSEEQPDARAELTGEAASAAGPEATPVDEEPAPKPGDAPAVEELPAVLREPQTGPGVPTRSVVLWGLAMVLLACTLAVQIGHFRANELVQRYPGLQPQLAQLCGITGCEIAWPRRPDRVRILDRELISHPAHTSAILVRATLLSDAPFVQSYPLMRLNLTDREGRIVASRDFTPREYLGGDADAGTGMAPGKPVYTKLEIVDPGPDAVGFLFEFL